MTDDELIDLIEEDYHLKACKTSSMFNCSIDDVFNEPASFPVKDDELPFWI